MSNLFVTQVDIHEVRNIKPISIQLSTEARKNLIITGRNGVGKTTLLNCINDFINPNNLENQQHYDDQVNFWKKNIGRLTQIKSEPSEYKDEITDLQNQIRNSESWFRMFSGVRLVFNDSKQIPIEYRNGNFITSYFHTDRTTKLKTPSGISKISLKNIYTTNENAGLEFIQHIVNLKADRSFAKDDNDSDTVRRIDSWFEAFESFVHKIFNNVDLKLQFDKVNYNFNLVENGKEPYNFNQLSSGFSSIFSIVSDLIMRMESRSSRIYSIQGIVLIDEIETHLHVELQKIILPLLSSLFPNIQFIVTTHSPFILNSVDDAVIFDLEKRFSTGDLSGYSYETLIESYFDSDNYSQNLKQKLFRYEALMNKEELLQNEKDELFILKRYLNEIPKFLSDELAVRIQQIRLSNKNKSHGL